MKLQKLAIYSLAFVAFFGLSSNACDSLEDLVSNIEVPVDNVVEMEVVISEEDLPQQQSLLIVETIDPSSDPALDEYQDQIEDATFQEVVFGVEDRSPAGSADGDFIFAIDFAGGGASSWDYNYIISTVSQLDGLVLTADDFDGIGSIEDDFKAAILAKESIRVGVEGYADGPMDYKITATVKMTTNVGVQ